MRNLSQNDDGWDSSEQLKIVEQEQQFNVRFRGERARSILSSNYHSLEPDMASGWRPKLPSCPIPLSYLNPYVDSLKKILANHELYKIVYLGQRVMNSVQINQKYSYFWKHRQRYSLNVNVIKEAINKVGSQKTSEIKLQQCSYQFYSDFQSGNLDMVVKIKKDEYDCFIRSDTNTKGHSNWYFFKVKNNNEIGTVKFNICNMTKCKNLYTQGMKPFCREGLAGQWNQNPCFNVNFVQRLCRYGFNIKTYQLQFSYNFTSPNQQVYFAYSIPYTYSDLQSFINIIKKQQHVKISNFCQSLGGVQLPLIFINDTNSSINSRQNQTRGQKLTKKKVIVMTARIHPGQSNSSYLIEGFIKELLNKNSLSYQLLKRFVFYIVPMLNPDGVIVGNFRTSYSGKDLNRQFQKINKFIFPQIFALGELCQKIKKSYHKSIQFYFDFHGHSSKKNLFCYGPEYTMKNIYYFKARALAKLIEKTQPMFSYKDSIFTISQQKRTTARAYMLWRLNIPMTFTFEMSNGLLCGLDKTISFLDKPALFKAGQSLVKGLYKYAQVEMKIPRKQIKAKVDSGKYQTRKMKLVSASRSKFSSQHNKDTRQKLVQIQSPVSRQLSQISGDCHNDGRDFIQLMRQIKTENSRNQMNKYEEGGSDSQASDEDFNKAQSNQLYHFIVNRSNINNCIKNGKKGIEQGRYLMKIEQLPSNELALANQLTLTRRYESSTFLQKKYSKIKPALQRKSSAQRQKIPVTQKHFTMFI